ncbi:hypothetical protein [Niallia taxi]|uniref:hypothetical protein n=1 Tax=Niallia taxi TaxID=2499688 RepID=UPI003D2C2740
MKKFTISGGFLEKKKRDYNKFLVFYGNIFSGTKGGRELVRSLKESAIISLFIVIVNIVINFITNPVKFINEIKERIWLELAAYLVAMVLILVVSFLILFIKRHFFSKEY